MIAGLTAYAAAQSPASDQTSRQSGSSCYSDFQPLKAEAERRGLAVKHAIERKDKAPREEVCTLLKRYSEAEANIVKFIKENSRTCGIRPEAAAQMDANHDRTLHTQHQVCQSRPARIRM